MKTYKTSVLLLISMGSSLSWAADAAEKADLAIGYVELSARKVVTFADQKMTYVRVRPPVLPKAPPPPACRPPTSEEQAAANRMEEKAYASLSVTATVYLRPGLTPVTELRWADETGERSYHAWSSADFRYLTQLHHLETETTVYMWFPFVDVYTLEDWPADQKSPVPAELSFKAVEAYYFVDSRAKEVKNQETTLAGLDYLHAYYQLHYSTLKAEYERREAENAERERELKENPPKTPDVILRWWPITTKPSNP